jgi:peptidyl-prolyl cis-trans isomerase C
MKKAIIAAASAVVLTGALSMPALAQNVAVVNGKPVPQARLDALVKQIETQASRVGRPVPPDLKERLKDEVIAREVLAQEAQKLGLEGSPDFRTQLELARQSLMINALFADFSQKNPVSEADAKAEYDRVVKERQSAAGNKEFKARHILVETEDAAKTLIADLKKGGKFDDLAKKQSKDPGSGANGGDLGWSAPSAYVPEFAEALQKLGKGQLTETPVKTQFGWHVIRVDDIRDLKAPELPKFEEVKTQIVQQLEQEKLTKFQEELRAKAKVE